MAESSDRAIKTVPTIEEVRIHCSPQGDIWCSWGFREPIATGLSIGSFLGHAQIKPDTVIRMIGSKCNIQAILDTYHLILQGASWQLVVASPTICEAPRELDVPVIALLRCRQCALPPAVGGWHRFCDLDYPGYAIAGQLLKTEPDSKFIMAMWHGHPVCRAAEFIDGLQPDAAAMLVGEIVDPRWFVDEKSPDKTTKLDNFLGLNSKVQREAIELNLPHLTDYHRRCRLVYDCWAGATDLSQPNAFIARQAAAFSTDPLNNSLFGSKLFVAYLRSAWLRALCKDPGLGNELLPVEKYVDTPATLVALKDYLGM